MNKKLKEISLQNWCMSNGYNGVTKECVMSAFQSQDEKVQKLSKKEMIKGISNVKEEEEKY